MQSTRKLLYNGFLLNILCTYFLDFQASRSVEHTPGLVFRGSKIRGVAQPLLLNITYVVNKANLCHFLLSCGELAAARELIAEVAATADNQ